MHPDTDRPARHTRTSLGQLPTTTRRNGRDHHDASAPHANGPLDRGRAGHGDTTRSRRIHHVRAVLRALRLDDHAVLERRQPGEAARSRRRTGPYFLPTAIHAYLLQERTPQGFICTPAAKNLDESSPPPRAPTLIHINPGPSALPWGGVNLHERTSGWRCAISTDHGPGQRIFR